METKCHICLTRLHGGQARGIPKAWYWPQVSASLLPSWLKVGRFKLPLGSMSETAPACQTRGLCVLGLLCLACRACSYTGG